MQSADLLYTAILAQHRQDFLQFLASEQHIFQVKKAMNAALNTEFSLAITFSLNQFDTLNFEDVFNFPPFSAT